jgi:hypothetical protein
MFKNIIKSEKGYFTVEASIIMPLVIFLVISTLVISTIYYQNVINTLENQKLITDFTQYWPNYYKDIKTGHISYNVIAKKSIYSDLDFFDSHKAEKIEYLNSLIRTRKVPAQLFRGYMINEQYNNSSVSIHDNLFSKRLSLSVFPAIKLPFVNNEEIIQSSVTDQVNMIRNIDFVIETIKNLNS